MNMNRFLGILAEIIFAVFIFIITLGTYQQEKNKWY